MIIKNIKEDILNVLKKGIRAIKKDDVRLLKDLSNNTIHDASIYQDTHSTSIAVLMYSLFKIFQRSDYRGYKDWKTFYATILENLEDAYHSLNKGKIRDYELAINNIFNIIHRLDSRLKYYIKDVFVEAKIHKASRLHEHGISVNRTAEILGVNEWELMEYVGRTGISDVELNITKDVKERLDYARSLFR